MKFIQHNGTINKRLSFAGNKDCFINSVKIMREILEELKDPYHPVLL